MKSLLLAAVVAIGVVCTASSADAQYRGRRGGVIVNPTYGAPITSPYTYAYPNYYGSNYYSGTGVVVTSGYTPTVTAGEVIYSGGSYYNTPYYGSSYYAPSYSNQSYYGSPYYQNYNYSGITPTGAYYGGRRIIRW